MAYADNDGGIQITAKAKLTCTTISSTVATAHTGTNLKTSPY